MKQRIFALCLSISLLLCVFASCRGKDYTDDITAEALSKSILAALDDGNTYHAAAEGYFADYFELPADVTDYTVKLSADGNNINELGVFHVKNGKAKDLEKMLSDYLKRSYETNSAWYDSYIPEQTPKLRDAEVRAYGNYVVYAIFSTEDRAAVFRAAEEALAVK